ncbi:MAG: nuclear transport factor 2 family protein [Alphaproteobacteria bacterium]|nr:nuclear transport factor 2 family protein [Alphaproteobacteria bacterium]
MPDVAMPADFATIDITPWTGETPDEVLAAGAGEYSVAEARAIVRHFAEVSTSCDIDAFAQGFTEDCVISFNEHANIVGHAGLRALMAPRFARFTAPGTRYLCRKALRSLTGNTFGVIWINHWIDPETHKTMRSKGVEFWSMRAGRIARWDAAIVAWPA